MGATTAQTRVNTALWSRQDLLGAYAHRRLRPVEVLLLARYRDELTGRTLELGCGGGRLTGYLVQLGAAVTGIDISPAMVEYCRRQFPAGDFQVADLRDLSGTPDASHDCVLAGCNMLDLLDDAERRHTLQEIRRILVPGGLLVMSSHNAGHADRRRTPWQVVERNPVELARSVARLPVRLRNRRRILPLEERATDHALLNDEAHDFSVLHYYVTPDDQQRQFEELGFTLLERLDLDGDPIAPGELAPGVPEVHYVARSGAAG